MLQQRMHVYTATYDHIKHTNHVKLHYIQELHLRMDGFVMKMFYNCSVHVLYTVKQQSDNK